MMRYLPLLLMGPWLLILAWAYWAYPKSLPRVWARRLFDMLALTLAAWATVWLAGIGYDGFEGVRVDDYGRHSGAIWQQVAPILYAYAGFSAVLIPAALLRHGLWHQADGHAGGGSRVKPVGSSRSP